MASITELNPRLDQLATCETAEDVADLLRASGVRGRNGIANQCPIAHYVRGLLDEDRYVNVYTTELMVAPSNAGLVGGDWYQLPIAVQQFIDTFDMGEDFYDLNEEEA